jgi:hypothetical protein
VDERVVNGLKRRGDVRVTRKSLAIRTRHHDHHLQQVLQRVIAHFPLYPRRRNIRMSVLLGHDHGRARFRVDSGCPTRLWYVQRSGWVVVVSAQGTVGRDGAVFGPADATNEDLTAALDVLRE